uniref:MAGE domain-containing protein n=1 Tax=Sus scrofa TaxID=9823 RepID=A0A4X1SZD8_PIG
MRGPSAGGGGKRAARTPSRRGAQRRPPRKSAPSPRLGSDEHVAPWPDFLTSGSQGGWGPGIKGGASRGQREHPGSRRHPGEAPQGGPRDAEAWSGGRGRGAEHADASQSGSLHLKVADLVEFLLLKYCAKEPTTQAEMLSVVLRDAQDHFPEVLSQASELIHEHTYALVPTLGLTWDGVLSDGQSLPKTGLLVVLLGVILLKGECAPEEEVWGALGKMGVCAGREHCIYGEPRELLTQVWVQEGYLEYHQVPHSNPAHYEFLWGPRAHAETSKLQVLEHMLRVSERDPRSFLSLSEEAVIEEEGS